MAQNRFELGPPDYSGQAKKAWQDWDLEQKQKEERRKAIGGSMAYREFGTNLPAKAQDAWKGQPRYGSSGEGYTGSHQGPGRCSNDIFAVAQWLKEQIPDEEMAARDYGMAATKVMSFGSSNSRSVGLNRLSGALTGHPDERTLEMGQKLKAMSMDEQRHKTVILEILSYINEKCGPTPAIMASKRFDVNRTLDVRIT